MKAFKSMLEFQKHFDTDEKCRLHLEVQRWGNTPACPFCASIKVKRIKDGRRFQCNEKECRKQFSVTVGTVCENTKIPLTKWFLAMYILSNHSKGISSQQLAGWLGVTQKTAWFLNHRIRQMLTDNAPELLDGIVEVDETFVGGKVSNKHNSKRKDAGRFDNKTMVFGAVQRNGKVITRIIPDRGAESLSKAIKDIIHDSAVIISDEHSGYTHLSKEFTHAKVNHGKKQYVIGAAHTNTIEGYWNLLKKQIAGIHHSVSPKHLQRYCNEAAYRYNNRKYGQDTRFARALSNCEGKLRYIDLTKHEI